MATKSGKPKHTPQRTCVGCRTVLAKRTLIRIVRQPEGVLIDPTGKLNGRGAYLHNQRSCWQQALRGSLANALKTTLSAEDKARLENHIASLPQDSAPTIADGTQVDPQQS